ncbi:MAG: YncE family protein [Bryobacteraceae bacterium]
MIALAGTLGANAQNIYVSDVTGGVSVANPSTGAILASLPVTGTPSGLALAPGGQSLYVALYTAGSVAVINTASNSVLATIPVGKGPLHVAITPNGQTVYVVNSASNSVSVINAATSTVIATIPVGSAPTTLAVTPNGASVFVANLVSGTVSVIGTASNTVTATWQVGPGVSAIAISPDGGTLYVANRVANQVRLYGAASGTLSKTIGGLKWPDAIVIAPSGDFAYVSNGNGASVSVINTAAAAAVPVGIVATVGVPVGPTSVAISPDGSEVYVASQSMNSVSVISTATNAIVGKVALAAPFSVAAATAVTAPAPNLCSAAPTGLPALPNSVTLPALPQSCTVPVYPAPTTTVNVNTAAALQAALTNAQCGQWISVQAGIVYQGAFTVPGLACPANNPVLVGGSAIASLPPWTVPAQSLAGSSQFPTLESTNTNSPLFVNDGAANWYFAGIEITLSPTAYYIYPIVAMGENTTTIAALPQNITFDRVLIHPAPCTADSIAAPCNYVARGIDLNAVNGTVMFSNIWGIVNAGQDSQAINVNNTPGPGLILGNYLEATGENLMFNTECTITVSGSGSTGFVPGDSGISTCPPPSDFTVRLNHFEKQMAWQTLPAGCTSSLSNCYDVKNQSEVKHGQRILYDSNIFDTTYAGAQAEFLISNCFYTGMYVCQDLTYTNNLFEHGPQVGAVAGNGAPVSGGTTITTGQRFLYRNNLAVDINGITYGGPPCTANSSPPYINCAGGAFFQVQNTNGVIFDHNTTLNATSVYVNALNFSDAQPGTDLNFQLTNNFQFGAPFNDGGCPGCAIAALSSPVTGGQVFVGDYWEYPTMWGVTNSPVYPAGISSLSANATPVSGQPTCQENNGPIQQCWALDWALVGFVDFAGGNAGTDLPGAALASASPYHNAATDGMDIGANIPAVLAAIAGIVQ